MGSLIGSFSSPASSPEATVTDDNGEQITRVEPTTIRTGDFLTVEGMVYPRGSDDGANDFWRFGNPAESEEEASSTLVHGTESGSFDRQFSHLDIDDDTVFLDACGIQPG